MSLERSWSGELTLLASRQTERQARVAVVIPCYRAAATLDAVLTSIDPAVWRIYCVDDASPDETGSVIDRASHGDPRIVQVRRAVNGGVGAAVVDGIRAALRDGATVIVKLDSDGQMAPALIPDFVAPILAGEADYVKGNRFFSLDGIGRMPRLRIFGNAGLSFLIKLSTGYWDIFDPTNGYVAIHADVARLLPLDRLHRRYFFESDLLFRLATLRARVIELPIETVYDDEQSHLNELRCLATFPFLHGRNFLKRIFYNYFLRNFSVASLSIVAGSLFLGFGSIFGILSWIDSLRSGQPATAGTVMLSALPLILGIQLLLNFLAQDVAMAPSAAIHRRLASKRVLRARTDRTGEDRS
jgi:glycosyltransferase involved in cell wall biosynthesis